MLSEERRLIEDLFDRLASAENQPRDPEVEQFIADELRRVPHAPYLMAQTIIAQNQALEAAARRIEALEQGERHEESKWGPRPGTMGAPDSGPRGSVPAFDPQRGSVPPPQPQGGGFGGGGGSMPPPAPPQGGGFGGGGGFLANAGQMAMGVAGGMLAAEAARSLLGAGAAEAKPAAATPAAAT